MKVEPIDGEPTRFWVQSESRPDVKHVVDVMWQESPGDKPRPQCSCEDMMARKSTTCKHLFAVTYYLIDEAKKQLNHETT